MGELDKIGCSTCRYLHDDAWQCNKCDDGYNMWERLNSDLEQRSDLMGELKDFLDFLRDKGYLEYDDVYESPTAIDKYMETKKK